jgi:hypothetical protein
MPWKQIGSGSFNTAYISENGREVLKIRKFSDGIDTQAKFDHPLRSTRLWNELNPDLQPAAYVLYSPEYGHGWVCPFVQGIQASDHEISRELINIYTRTGRIIVDATAGNNFLKTPTGQIVCIDIGMALQLENETHNLTDKRRRKSLTSLEAWNTFYDKYQPFFTKEAKKYPESIHTLKALLFIQAQRPDIYDVSFLINNTGIIKACAKAYDTQLTQKALMNTVVSQAKKLLLDKVPIDFNHLKRACVSNLEQYIHSRGSINAKGEFEPSLITWLFRNKRLTKEKVEHAAKLIKAIESAPILEDMGALVSNNLRDKSLTAASFRSGLEYALNKCMITIDDARHPGLDTESSRFSP